MTKVTTPLDEIYFPVISVSFMFDFRPRLSHSLYPISCHYYRNTEQTEQRERRTVTQERARSERVMRRDEDTRDSFFSAQHWRFHSINLNKRSEKIKNFERGLRLISECCY